MNVALDALPEFSCLPGDGPHLRSGIIVGPSLAYMERAYFDARQHGWSRGPIVEMLIPSLVDPTLAPPGKHVASLFCQHANPQLPGGRSWDDARDEVSDLMLDTVDRYAPGFRASVIALRALSPLDLEREFGLTGGDIFHGQLSLDQLFSARPVRAASSSAYLVLLGMEVAAFPPHPCRSDATRLCGPVPRLPRRSRERLRASGRYPASRSSEPGLSSPGDARSRRRQRRPG